MLVGCGFGLGWGVRGPAGMQTGRHGVRQADNETRRQGEAERDREIERARERQRERERDRDIKEAEAKTGTETEAKTGKGTEALTDRNIQSDKSMSTHPGASRTQANQNRNLILFDSK